MKEMANPEMVILARQYRSLTQTELADLSGLKNWQISKVENQIQQLTEDVLDPIANALCFPKSFFFISDSIVDGTRANDLAPLGHYRKRSTISARANDQIHAEINIRLIHIRRLQNSISISAPLLPWSELSSMRDQVPETAIDMRHFFEIPSGPVRNLCRYLESKGILIVPCCNGVDGFDGYSLKMPIKGKLIPIIFVNFHMPPDRIRFTIAHELAHLLFHESFIPDKQRENEANIFASEFLMPSREISPQLTHVTVERLRQLKRYWGTSMSSILYVASKLNRVSERQKQYLWMRLGQLGYRKVEPDSDIIPPERPFLLKEILDAHQKDLSYTIDDLCTLLCIKVDEFHRLFDQESHIRHMRIVREEMV